ncbi:MAG: bifunctional serine/threonine-protein kinase/formylglycine-generating enzyme family protein [Rubripirellula sp.]
MDKNSSPEGKFDPNASAPSDSLETGVDSQLEDVTELHEEGVVSDAPSVRMNDQARTVNEKTADSRSGSVSWDESPAQKTFGRYAVQGTLGTGGMGKVYLAEDQELKRLVALKIPRTRGNSNPRILTLHRREAQTVAALEVPGVVPVYDVGVERDGTIYIVSKYIRGSDLQVLMERRALNRHESVRICKKVAETLHSVHLHSIVHRDIKPGNILVDDSGEPLVSDFGLALRPSEYGKSTGRIGTLRYMSPEQVRGESHLVDGRSDLFSLGVILYELLTGQRPFDGPDAKTIQHCIQFVEPKPLRQIDDSIPTELERICLRMLDKKASGRYGTGKDFADDLAFWLGESAAGVKQTQADTDDQPAVIPRGLRAFRGRDSGFFLDLLPGPRDRGGMPDVVRHWKSWIEERSPDKEYHIGVIYGPSGCGKSSILQAGILPLLGHEIDVATIQATSDSFDTQLRRRLRRRSPPVEVEGVDLDQMSAASLIAHRRENGGADDRSLLLVIDQFEHWLLNCTPQQSDELAMTLRQCDGVTTKAILLVRDDFWVALGRFMTVVDIPLIQDINCSLVDLFDPAHAQKVLESFGRAHNRLPAEAMVEPAHAQFLTQAVDDLTRAGKVYPVQLALFAEMLKGRPWVPETLDRLGGIEGIGTQFLEEAFEAEHTPVQRRIHTDAARRVLESLLPEAGMDVRNRFATRDELQQASGYAQTPEAFDDLLSILAGELRLISTTDRIESMSGHASSPRDSSDSYTSQEESTYQLSHDFLIPSVREWVSRKQLETYRGRLSAQLSEMSSLWSAKHAKRFLPSWGEWVRFRLFVPGNSLRPNQQQMMKYASRHHLTNSAIVLAVMILIAFAFRHWRSVEDADSVMDQLTSARFAELPTIATQFKPFQSQTEPEIQAILDDSTESVQHRVAAEMVMLQWGKSDEARLLKGAILLPPDEVEVVGNYVRSHSDELADRSSGNAVKPKTTAAYEYLWSVLEDSSASQRQRIAAGQLLVGAGEMERPENSKRLESVRKSLANLLVSYGSVHPRDRRVLTRCYRPLTQRLVGPLSATMGAKSPSLELVTALDYLTEFLQDDPRQLADLALDASSWQLEFVASSFDANSDSVIPFLRDMIRPVLSSKADMLELSERNAVRMATAGALLVRLSDSDPVVWNLLRFNPKPTLRATMIHRLAEVGAPRHRLINRLVDEQDTTVVTALLMALGQYDAPSDSEIAEDQVVSQAIERVMQSAVGARDPGTMSAANWLIECWGMQAALDGRLSSPPGGVLASPLWRTTPSGHVMVRFDASQHPGVGRVFEVATQEVTVEQFLKLLPHTHYNAAVSLSSDYPMNVVQWENALRYCRLLSEAEHLDEMCFPPVDEIESGFVPEDGFLDLGGYRLPTAAEWEFACRAGTTGSRYFGENGQVVRYYAHCETKESARPAGSLKPNDAGLFDMFGNIMEWTGTIVGEKRALRGGAYSWEGNEMRVDISSDALPGTEFNSIGFRVVRTVEPSTMQVKVKD